MSSTDETLATGGSDSIINIWTDCTKEDEEDAVRKEVETMGKLISELM